MNSLSKCFVILTFCYLFINNIFSQETISSQKTINCTAVIMGDRIKEIPNFQDRIIEKVKINFIKNADQKKLAFFERERLGDYVDLLIGEKELSESSKNVVKFLEELGKDDIDYFITVYSELALKQGNIRIRFQLFNSNGRVLEAHEEDFKLVHLEETDKELQIVQKPIKSIINFLSKHIYAPSIPNEVSLPKEKSKKLYIRMPGKTIHLSDEAIEKLQTFQETSQLDYSEIIDKALLEFINRKSKK